MKSLLPKSFYLSFSALVFLFLVLSDPVTAQQKPSETGGELFGTWKLVSTKYGDAKEFTKYPETSMRLKLINKTHFTWLEVDDKKKVLASAGGRYSLVGNVYTETIDFAGEGMDAYVGKPQKFTIKIEGDKLFQSGELSDGLKIEENWARQITAHREPKDRLYDSFEQR